jgi:hypothetical protein
VRDRRLCSRGASVSTGKVAVCALVADLMILDKRQSVATPQTGAFDSAIQPELSWTPSGTDTVLPTWVIPHIYIYICYTAIGL